MKAPTVLLGEMTDPEVDAYVGGGGDTVLVPVGATEQHGPHSPLSTDTLLASEVVRDPASNAQYPTEGAFQLTIVVVIALSILATLCALILPKGRATAEDDH